LIKDAIKKKKQAGLQSGKLSEDLLTSLLQVRDEITGEPIPEQQIIDEAVNFLFAGHGKEFQIHWIHRISSLLLYILE
jgi:cytochrome P450